MAVEEAIMTPLTKINLNNFHYRGENDSMKNLCKKFNKNFIEVYNKVKYNHTFEWAMNSTKTKYDSKN